ncbi:MAG: cobalamin-dependent protein [Bacteroidales bacterium]|nr:cobalamin-dependent protein [Bacteroidales bacterium]
MKIAFIYPRFEKLIESRIELKESGISKKNLGDFSMPPALGIPIMVALTGSEHTTVLYDENIEPINYDDDADLIAVSFFTPQAEYAYKVAQRFREKGKTVIAGGMHPSLMVDEALQYFDAVCIGEVEAVWNQILTDFQNNNLQKTYQQLVENLDTIPFPDRAVFRSKDKYDWTAKLIQVMRGCAYFCENCIIPSEFGKNFRFRSVGKVIDELNLYPISGDYYLIDDTLSLPDEQCEAYRNELFNAFAQLETKPRLFISGSLNMSCKPEFLTMLKNAGVVNLYLVTGADPYSIRALQGDKKFIDMGLNMIETYRNAGIEVYISVGLGFDHQKLSVFDNALDFIQKAKLSTAEFYILTPFPQTRVWHKFRSENRILHYNWSKYNTANVVFKPKHMTEQQLLDGYLKCWNEFYTSISISESLKNFKK